MRRRLGWALLMGAAALHGQGAVEGKVVATTNGAPVRKAIVLLRPGRMVDSNQTRPRDSYAAETDSSGKFSITGMVAGTYECVASRTGFGGQPPGSLISTKYTPLVTVEDGKTVSDVMLKLTPLGVIYGRVLDPDGDPVAHAAVAVSVNAYGQGKRQRVERGQAQTNDRGEYRIFNLFPGTYYVQAMNVRGMMQVANPNVRGPRPMVMASTYYPSTIDPTQAGPVELAAGGDTGPIDVHMQRIRVFSIRGKGAPPDQTRAYNINAQRQGGDNARAFFGGFSTMGQDGQWEIGGLEPGSYIVTMNRFEMASGRVVNNPGTMTQMQALVEIVDHDVDGVVFSDSIGGQVSGVLQSTGQNPAKVQGLQVSLTMADGGGFNGQNYTSAVKADGSFSIPNVMPERYSIRIEPPNNTYIVAIKAGSQELPAHELDLRHGGQLTLAITVGNDFAEAEGKVTDADGNPDPLTNVTFVPDQKLADWVTLFRNQITDSQGHFHLRNLAPGAYTVFAWKDAPNAAPRDPEFRKPFEKQGTAVKLEAGSHQTLDLKSIVTQK